MRKFISIILGLILIGGAFYISKSIVKNKNKKSKQAKVVRNIVSVQTVENSTIPLSITTSGTLKAKYKIDLFTEVQGILKQSSKDFKAGTYFNKGETILSINSDEHLANLRSLKSNFYSSLTTIMPDLQLDYPEAYPKWKEYINNFDMQKPLNKLPEMDSDKEKYFITGRQILSSYYNVKNAEVRMSKYKIKAPYSGVLSETTVNPGSLIRQGQRLGELISTSVYELEVNVNSLYDDMLRVGSLVELNNLDHSKSWKGKISRINPKVDGTTQTIKVYIELKDKTLKEGMYLEANLPGESINNAFEVGRNLLVDESNLFIVNDTVLKMINIKPVFFNKNTVVVQGLEDGQQLIKTPVPGAYDGMLVQVKKNDK